MSKLNEQIKSIRTDYDASKLEEKEIAQNPLDQFSTWMAEAVEKKITEPNAMMLSTVSELNRPSARIVLLRGVDASGFVFYTNYESNKSNAMAKNNHVALTFFWPELERQIRIEGTVEKVEDSVSDNYFAGRPRESQLGAWASPQSNILTSREELEEKLDEITRRFEGKPVDRPPFWGGFVVQPDYYEFWQGRSSRLHDRIVFSLKNGEWTTGRLAP